MTFQKIIDKYRKIAFSEQDKGERFERLMQGYLKTDPKYSNLFRNVWLWSEFFGRKDLGGSDTGIDLVAQTVDGDYWAIQCKCYLESSVIDKPKVDSFLSTSSREFKDEDLKTTKFSHRLWISTTNKWGINAEESIKNQNPPVTRLTLDSLKQAPVDWEKLENGIHGNNARVPKKKIMPHQREALQKTHEYFKYNDRGKLIMACGTGKTFNSLRIAENETNGSGLILFLVPSIALLGQTLLEWTSDAKYSINAVCICSDPEISKSRKKNDDTGYLNVVDLALPASTKVDDILYQFERIKKQANLGLTVVFSTYQSIDVISKAQKRLLTEGFNEFDLIICDEAHRTTGITLAEEDESAFTKVHDNNFIKAKKRLYMTATPRLYSDDIKIKAAQAEAILCSMDDSSTYGDEIYRIGFGEAVERDLLTDYKVLILTLNDKDVPPAVQRMISDGESEISTDDASKIIGTINALSKQFLGDEGVTKESDPEPMRRAVAFCANIATSKKISATYNTATEAYLDHLPVEKKAEMVSVESKHMDGTMAAPERSEILSWLKDETDENQCRIITNVRVLSEGVDVPSLDSVLFLSARNSQVDVVQSVGRVMRKSPGKKYGYIIIPVVVPADVEADKALDDNERYKVVWTVLNALRAHDDRFNATVNKIDLNKKKPNNILISRPGYSFDEDGNLIELNEDEVTYETSKDINKQLALQFEQLQSVVYARLVQKVGDRRYWEQWAKDVANIAERQIERITYLIENKKDQRKSFDNFLEGLQKNINPSITEKLAVEMLAQHIITKPIFEALFESYSFEKNNAVSIAMQSMLNSLEDGSNLAEQDMVLQKFYESVRKRAEGIDNAEGKQKIIIELYDKFFKTAFPKLVEQLGIVYTPVEVVDFIINSVEQVLNKEFNRSISDENIQVLDPFTGTGTFITRLLQSGYIKTNNLKHKYKNELHANELVLLAYYIAAVNIENAFHDQMGEYSDYETFEGIVLTDTFQLGETQAHFSNMFPQNSARVERQKNAPLRVIIGNPPYSIGQKSANDNAQNQKYEKLDSRIAETYGVATDATNKNSLYNSYIKAFRWSTDRLDTKNGGIIAFVSNGAWLDSASTNGFRKVIEKEFSSIWVFNLRGNARTQGEQRRKEAGNVFSAGSRNPISITLLIKNPRNKKDKATIHYYDIGDYLSKEEKLEKIRSFKSISSPAIKWESINPNEHGDWLNKRNNLFESFIPIESDKGFNLESNSYFVLNTLGLTTGRDSWCVNFSKYRLSKNVNNMISFYNKQLEHESLEDVDNDPAKISWSRGLRRRFRNNENIVFKKEYIIDYLYRPFNKTKVYYNRELNEYVYKWKDIHPDIQHDNKFIYISCKGTTKGLSLGIGNNIADAHFNGDTQCFPLYYYEEVQTNTPGLYDLTEKNKYVRRDGISDFILERAKKIYGKNTNKKDIFYYIYGILHSPDYCNKFKNELKIMLPRIPLVNNVQDFMRFSNAGYQLADLHINYEKINAYEGVDISGEDSEYFKVEKMRFPKKGQKDTIIYNSKIVVSNIPEKAYEYIVNGKSAVEWIMERYQVKIDKKSGIKNDPNDWSEEVGNPRYILDLLLSVINVSVQTVDIVNDLPNLDFENL